MKWKWLILILVFGHGIKGFAQQKTLDTAIQVLSKEKDPGRSVQMTNEIIRNFQLDPIKDAETIDLLYGTVAVNYARQERFSDFERYLQKMRNKFNQTSFMNMVASDLVTNGNNLEYAVGLAKKTIDLYHSYRSDPAARPENFEKADWERFMSFAQYPYYDTYAHALFELKQYREALRFQQLAFDSEPEQGIPASVERYAKLLQLNGKKEEARLLLLKRARLGKLNKGMTEQLQSIYISGKGTDKDLGLLLDSLHKNIQSVMVPALKDKMLNEIAPSFTLKDLKGNKVSLEDYRDRIVVQDLWATWCAPCIASFPAMQLMVKKHPEVAFLFIAVNENEKDPMPKVKRFIEKSGYTFTVLVDEPVSPGSEIFRISSTYKPNGIPAKYIIDQKGILRFKTSGFDTDAELMNELEAMFTVLKSMEN